MHKPDNVIRCLYSLVSTIGKVDIGSGERQDDSGQGFVGLGLVVLVDTPAAPRVEEADQVTGHRAEPFILMRVPAAFLLDYLVPRLYEVLDGPATDHTPAPRQSGARHLQAVPQRPAPGRRYTDGAGIGQSSAPSTARTPQMRADGNVSSYRTQRDNKTVNYGRHRATSKSTV